MRAAILLNETNFHSTSLYESREYILHNMIYFFFKKSYFTNYPLVVPILVYYFIVINLLEPITVISIYSRGSLLQIGKTVLLKTK